MMAVMPPTPMSAAHPPSWPRVVVSSLPAASQASHGSYGAYIAELLAGGMVGARRGTDTGDHPPITPVRLGGGLSGSTASLFNMIVRHFICTVSPDCEYITTKVRCTTFSLAHSLYQWINDHVFACATSQAVATIGEEEFSTTGKRVTVPGWTALSSLSSLADTLLPEFRQGQRLGVRNLALREGQTKPPGYLTESELITMMEKHGA